MKITDVHLTLFGWTYSGHHVRPAHGKFSGKSQLGLVTIETDEGVRATPSRLLHAWRAHGRQSLIQYLKPVVLNQDPLERERL